MANWNNIEKPNFNKNRPTFSLQHNKEPARNSMVNPIRKNLPTQKSNSEQEFYYSNIYKTPQEVNAMPNNVRFDLEPFRDFIDRSIRSIEKAHEVGADVIIPDRNVYLELIDSLVKIKKTDGITHKIQKPSRLLFRLDFDGESEINSLNDIEEITIGRMDSLWKNIEENKNESFFLE